MLCHVNRVLPSKVSTHASARGGDRLRRQYPGGAYGVSTHASAREATSCSRRFVLTVIMFQPTPPRGRRLELPGLALLPQVVSTHASAREATPAPSRSPGPCTCFNPRLRAGGDHGSKRVYFYARVSTHASAREATLGTGNLGAPKRVSTHASAREATCPASLSPHVPCVSTHASAREATAAHADDGRV